VQISRASSHGKSGSGWLRSGDGTINENQPQGWFVGWARKGGRQIVFARFLVGKEKSETPGGTVARNTLLSDVPIIAASR